MSLSPGKTVFSELSRNDGDISCEEGATCKVIEEGDCSRASSSDEGIETSSEIGELLVDGLRLKIIIICNGISKIS